MVAALNLARNKFCHNRLHYKKNFKKFYNYLLIILFFSEYFEGELTNTRALPVATRSGLFCLCSCKDQMNKLVGMTPFLHSLLNLRPAVICWDSHE